MRHLFEKVLGVLKENWNIWGSLIVAILWAWWKGFSITSMNKTTSFLTMTLMLAGVITFIKTCINRYSSNKSQPLEEIRDEILIGQQPIRSIKFAINPEKECSKIVRLVIVIFKEGRNCMNKVKKVFSWIKKYWQQIVGLLGTLSYTAFVGYGYLNDKFGWILQYFPEGIGWEIGVKVGFGIIALVFIIFMLRNQVKWVGVGSLEQAEKYLAELAISTTTKLSSGAKAQVKNVLSNAKKVLKELEAKVSKLKKELSTKEKEIVSAEELQKLGLYTVEAFNQLIAVKNDLTQQIARTEAEVLEKKAEIAKYEAVL